jgi:hypothetical protein
MFEMTDAETQAFSEGTHGVSISTYSHTLVFLIGTAATVWLTLIFVGVMRKKELSGFEAIQEFGWAVLIFIAVGIAIYFG